MDPRGASSPEFFADLVHTLRESLLPPPVTAIPATSPMARPTSFSGEAVSCNGFLLQCSLYFELQSHQFTTERAKVAFIISLLMGRALQWAEALWSSQSPRINSLEDLLNISVKFSASRLLRSQCMMSCSSYGKLIHQFTSTRFVFAPSPLAAAGTRLPCFLPIAEAWTPLYVSRCPSTMTLWGLRASSRRLLISLNT